MKYFFNITAAFVSVFLLVPSSASALPSDLSAAGNIQGMPERKDIQAIVSLTGYGVLILPGDILPFPKTGAETGKPGSAAWRDSLAAHVKKQFAPRFSGIPYLPVLTVLGERDFALGLHDAVSAIRSANPRNVHVLDYIGARNNEDPVLLKYIDILINGKTFRFVGFGAWENLQPKGESVSYRKPTASVMRELREYLSSRKKVDFTVLITHQSVEADRELARNADAAASFDLIVAGHPETAGFTEGGMNRLPILASGARGEQLWKVFFHKTPGGKKLSAWRDAAYKRSF